MSTTSARDLIAVLQTTLDGRILDANGASDWVDSWADGLEVLPPVDAFLLGAGMFAGYEQFWPAILADPTAAARMLGRDPYPREIAYAEAATRTEHLVLSTTLTDVAFPSARIVRSVDEVRAFKHQGPGTVYVVGGPTLITSLLRAGLLDELRLIVHPILIGAGRGITELLDTPQRLDLVAAEPAASDRVTLTYRVPRVELDADDFNRSVIREFRANGGVVGGELADMSLLLLTTTDASDGHARTTPLAYHRRGDRYLVIASNGGATQDPAWFTRVERGADLTVEIGTDTFAAKATILHDAEREAAFASIVAAAPSAETFQARAGRTIPVLELALHRRDS